MKRMTLSELSANARDMRLRCEKALDMAIELNSRSWLEVAIGRERMALEFEAMREAELIIFWSPRITWYFGTFQDIKIFMKVPMPGRSAMQNFDPTQWGRVG